MNGESAPGYENPTINIVAPTLVPHEIHWDSFRWAREEASRVGGNAVEAAQIIVDKYSAALIAEGREVQIDELHSDLVRLSGYIVYVGTMAARYKAMANIAKLDIAKADSVARKQIIAGYEQQAQKWTKTQVDAEVKVVLYDEEANVIEAQSRADALQNLCASLQEFVNTLKHLGNRLAEERRTAGVG